MRGVVGRVLLTRSGGDDFVFFLSGWDRTTMGEDYPDRIAEQAEISVKAAVQRKYTDEVASLLEISVGVRTLRKNQKVHLERLIYRGIKEAQIRATNAAANELDRKKGLLKKVLRESLLHTLYQPIVDTEKACVLGYEVLTRGDVEGLSNPQALFQVAEASGLVWELSRIIRRIAVEPIDECKNGELFFINMHPTDFSDPQFLRTEIWDPQLGRLAARLVFEITERAAIHDYELFRDYITTLKKLGYRIAVDDLGSGYAGLTAISALEPDFIKFDMALIRDIHLNTVKQNLVKSMMRFAVDIGCEVVAEGVEQPEERDTLCDLGCRYHQGYYFARPGKPFPVIPPERFKR